MMTRLRVILPPSWAIITFLLIYIGSEGPVLFFERKAGQPLDIVHPALLLARLFALLYGAYRVRMFHPAFLHEYRTWLERTPWTSRKSLPGGPVHLVWGDLLVFGALAASVAGLGLSQVYAVISIGLIGHSLMLAVALLRTGPAWAGFLVAFGAGLAIRLWSDRLGCLSAAMATQILGWLGLRISLARFPWANLPAPARPEALLAASCGWPFDQLRPHPPTVTPGRGLLIGTSLILGWLFFAAEGVLAGLGVPGEIDRIVFVQALIALAFGRIAIYCQGYEPPMSLVGRLRSFRWIIPGYDQVYLAPLCIALIGLLAVDRFRPPIFTEEVALAVGLALAMMVCTTAGPELIRWRLTGDHRIAPSNLKKAGQELVRVG